MTARKPGPGDAWKKKSRQVAQLRARSLLATKWKAVERIAGLLQKRTTLLGDEVADICRREGVRRLGEGLPISKAEAMNRMSPRGKQRLLGMVAADGRTNIEKAVNR